MAVILDTNLLSELLRLRPDTSVIAWLDQRQEVDLFSTSINQAEMLRGAHALPTGKRKDRLLEEIRRLFQIDLAGRVLPFTSAEAPIFATMAATRRAMGKPISDADCQIAAIAMSSGHILATRNTKDFEHCGIDLIDPWDYSTDEANRG